MTPSLAVDSVVLLCGVCSCLLVSSKPFSHYLSWCVHLRTSNSAACAALLAFLRLFSSCFRACIAFSHVDRQRHPSVQQQKARSLNTLALSELSGPCAWSQAPRSGGPAVSVLLGADYSINSLSPSTGIIMTERWHLQQSVGFVS
jgi:hypothetical protein